MARRKGRKSKRRAYGRLRKAGRRARSIFSKPARLFGIRSDGLHVSDAVIASGLAATFLLPAGSAPESSAIGAIMGSGGYSSYKMEQRLAQALDNACVVGLGRGIKGEKPTGGYAGIGAAAVMGGVGLKVAGKFVNPFMRGSAVKL